MPKFRVTRLVDAWARYTCEVNADDADEAKHKAEEFDQDWEADGVQEFQDERFEAEELAEAEGQ